MRQDGGAEFISASYNMIGTAVLCMAVLFSFY